MAKKKAAPHGARERDLRDALRKAFGKHAALTLGEDDAAGQIKEYLPTGIDVLDNYVVGCGGLPVGRISETFSDEGAGKTSLGYSAAAAVQRMGGVAVWLDPEYSIDETRAALMGVDVRRLLVLQPPHLEQLFQMVKAVLAKHDGKAPMLIVWDSIASTLTKSGISLEAGDRRVGDVPLLMSEELKKLLDPLHKKRAHFMMINQVRAKIGVVFGSNITTPGGNAPKFYASVRLWIMGGKAVKNTAGEHTGKVVTVMAVKNRLQPPWRKAKVRFDYAAGWNNEWSTIEFAIRGKLIDPRDDKGKKHAGRKAYLAACTALGWPAAQGSGDDDDGSIEIEVAD